MPSNQRLDPLGIYGTRSASRQQAAKRRRRLQQRLLAAVVVAGVMGGAYLWRQSPSPSDGVDWFQKLPVDVATAPAFAGEKGLIVAATTGQVRLMGVGVDGPGDQGQTVFSTAFPPQSAPLVVGTRAFIPGLDGALTAIDWKTGRNLWRLQTSSALTASPISLTLPATAERAALPLVVAANDSGEVVAMEAGAGKPLWRQRLEGPAGNSIAKALVQVPGNLVPVVLVPTGTGVASRGGLTCIDARDGKVRWQFPRDGRVYGSALAAPALETDERGVAQTVFFATLDGLVVALDPLSGQYAGNTGQKKPRWKIHLPAGEAANATNLTGVNVTPTWLDKEQMLVLAASDNTIRALNGQNGQQIWSFGTKQASLAKVRLVQTANGALIVAGDGRNYIYGLEPETGRLRRKWKIRGDSGPIWTDLSPDGTQLFALNKDSFLQGIRL